MPTDQGLETRLRKQLMPAAKLVTTTALDHFPDLLIYTCLSQTEGVAALTRAAALMSEQEFEMVSMPRRGYGPRPVSVLSPGARVSYTALVAVLADALPGDSRARGRWTEHREFGRTGDHSYVVDLDLASCYQFIDHTDLRDELVLRSMDADAVSALMTLLDRITDRGRGLPQMVEPSDRLADTYLEIIGRRLARQGWLYHRYADDFRVLTESWDEANEIIEAAAAMAQDLGLILASHKTNVRLKATVDQTEAEFETFLDDYLERAEASRMWRDTGPYEEDDEEDEEDSVETDAVAAAYWDVLDDWHRLFQSETHHTYPLGMASTLAAALRHVAHLDERVTDQLLLDLVFDEPLRMEHVCRYISERAQGGIEGETQWELLHDLTGLGRQSPWAKIWLLSAAEVLVGGEKDEVHDGVLSWIERQLTDQHEVVRAQAAWTVSLVRDLTMDELKTLYLGCSAVSAPALAAVAGLQAPTSDALKKAIGAIRDESLLNKAAFAWAQSSIQTD